MQGYPSLPARLFAWQRDDDRRMRAVGWPIVRMPLSGQTQVGGLPTRQHKISVTSTRAQSRAHRLLATPATLSVAEAPGRVASSLARFFKACSAANER